MCLGIPGQLLEISSQNAHLARVDVSGVTRIVNVGLLEDEPLRAGDWVLIHVGFAMSKIDEEEAALALASLQLMGQAYDDELNAFWTSQIAGAPPGDRSGPPAHNGVHPTTEVQQRGGT
jgi:hydrogenase expression/formation protein HypC